MRVISGTARGRVLKSIEGEATRPTTDKVKESIFNIIQFEIADTRVLDLFGGSGQLAIEAISRGAKSAVVCENSKQASAVIKENVKKCGFENEIRIHRGDFTDVLTKDSKYDVIFLDPPYNSGLLSRALEIIQTFDILSLNGIIVCETDGKYEIRDLKEPYKIRKEYKYGRIKLTVICKDQMGKKDFQEEEKWQAE